MTVRSKVPCRQSWERISLVDLAAREPHSLVDGPFGSDLKLTDITSSGVPLVRIQHIGVGEFREGFDQFITEKKAHELRRHAAQAGDLVFAKLGNPPGRSTLLPPFVRHAVIVADCVRLRIDKEKVDPKYLAWAVNAPDVLRQIAGSSKGSTRQRANLADFKKVVIPVPRSREEQRHIAWRLDCADRLRRMRHFALEMSEGILRVMFLEMFGDRRSPKGGCTWSSAFEVCESITDCVNKTAPLAECVTPYRMLRTTNVRHGEVDTENVRYVDKATYETWTRRSKPRWGDVILTREAPLGEVGILRSNANVFLGQRLVQYRVDASKATPEFLAYGLMSNDVQAQLHRLGYGSTVEHVAVPDCESLLIPRAPLPIQQQFSAVERLVDRNRAVQREALRQAEHLFQTLLREAFGEA